MKAMLTTATYFKVSTPGISYAQNFSFKVTNLKICYYLGFHMKITCLLYTIVANLNLNHRRNFKSHLHYDIILKFKTEIKYEIDFYYYFYFAFHLC